MRMFPVSKFSGPEGPLVVGPWGKKLADDEFEQDLELSDSGV
jgi:hypothetical protein